MHFNRNVENSLSFKVWNLNDVYIVLYIDPHVKFHSAQFSEVGKYLKVKYDRNSVKVRK